MKKKGVIWLSAACAVISGTVLADGVSTDTLFGQIRNHQLTAIGYPAPAGKISNAKTAKTPDMEALFSAWRQQQQPSDAYYALLAKEGDGWTIRRISGAAIAADRDTTRVVSVPRDATGDTTIAMR